MVNKVRKDEQHRLYAEGNVEAARALKKTRYILMSNRSTLQKKDEDASSGKVIHKESDFFNTEDIQRKVGYEAKYNALLKENELFTLDLVKEKLFSAYSMTDEVKLAEAIADIMDICEATENKHLLWFRELLDPHFEGIIAHATINISAGKIEGINQKIKTLRRHGYGYLDDEYNTFQSVSIFLLLFCTPFQYLRSMFSLYIPEFHFRMLPMIL